MKKQVLITILFALAIPVAHAKEECRPDFYIISDFDDTIKTYGHDHEVARIGNALFRTKINAGMDTLFQEMVGSAYEGQEEACAGKNLFTVLTASPTMITCSIKRLLRKQNFTRYELITRPLKEKTQPYKVDRVTKVSERENVPLILIGDDTSRDAHAYHEFAEENPTEVLETYIHNVRNEPNLPGQIKYVTTYEIALNELVNSRLTVDATLATGQTLLSRIDKEIIPPYGHCPSDYDVIETGVAAIDLLSEEIEERVESICSQR